VRREARLDQDELRQRHIVSTVERRDELVHCSVVGMVRHDKGKRGVIGSRGCPKLVGGAPEQFPTRGPGLGSGARLHPDLDLELHATDADFARSPGLRWRNPLA
jgi:hypothetical protein